MRDLLRIQALTVELPTAQGWVRPVNEVSLRIAVGECLGLVGESGSGKTMLSLALMGLLPTGARLKGRGGKIVESGQAVEILYHPRQPYTRELLAAVPEVAAR